MSTQTVRSILRLVAVLTVFVGGIGFWTGIIAAFAFRQFMNSASEGMQIQSVSNAGWFAVLSWLVIMASGGALYCLSAWLARHITSEHEPAFQASVRHEGGRI